jgi:hypothetical protein
MTTIENTISFLRAEDFRSEQLVDYYIPFVVDESIVKRIIDGSQILLVGSRGTGKTMLLRMAEIRLSEQFSDRKILPLFVSFNQSRLIDTKYIRQWMLAKVLYHLQRKLQKMGVVSSASPLIREYLGINVREDQFESKLTQFILLLEDSWKKGSGLNVESSEIVKIFGDRIENIDILNEIDIFKALAEEICDTFEYRRINILFDEAAHNFIPAEQREFFGLFRDMRSPFLCGVAAVYPGLTSYGTTFQLFHDATPIRVERNIDSPDYLDSMEKIIEIRIDAPTWNKIRNHKQEFHALIYAASGNPRLLLKSLLMATEDLRTFRIKRFEDTIRDFYRSDIWNEHTRLSEIYKGHKPLIDWGRNFIEGSVLPETKKKNDDRTRRNDMSRTIYFVVHKDAPQAVKSALSILEYTGIVSLITEGVKMTRSELGNRYALNFGCVLAQEIKPISKSQELLKGLDIKRFTEYGFRHPSLESIDLSCSLETDPNLNLALTFVLNKPVQELDLTVFQLNKLTSDLKVRTIGDILKMTEADLMMAERIGEKRARTIMNIALNAALEYISG